MDVATDYGGQTAYGAQAWQSSQAGSGFQPGFRRRRAVAVIALLLSVIGLGVAVEGVATQLMPRRFTAQQQKQIMDWEAGKRWRELPAGKIFPASIQYQPPPELGASALPLTASRIGIARQASCAAATDAAVAAVLNRYGCEAVLRATYADATGSYVLTVGVAAFPGSAQVNAALRELAGPSLTGVRTVRFKNSPAAWFTNSRRQISASSGAGTYAVLYTVGYGDDRPREPVTTDRYADSEMVSMGTGVEQAVAAVLAKQVLPPRCPGTPGC